MTFTIDFWFPFIAIITAGKDTRTDQNRTERIREDNVSLKECYGTLVVMIEYHFSRTNLS